MSEEFKYSFPEFITQELGNGSALPENEMKLIDDIYNQSANFTYPDARTEMNWQKIESKIVTPSLVVVKKPLLSFSFAKWAAAAVIVLSVAFGIWKSSIRPVEKQEFAFNSSNALKKITLPDGSVITLNNYSSFTTNDFNSGERIITLAGEAFFEVNHNNKPFIVRTGAGDIKVMGTKFNVKNRKNTPFEVALSSGSISLITKQGNFEMKPGDVITSNDNVTFVKSEISNATLCWLESKLIFENEELYKIIFALEAQYNITFEYDKKLKDEKLTLTFNQLSAKQAAELLSKTLNSKVIVK